MRTDIDLTETTLHVFNVHLGTSFLERRQQARKLVSPEILQNPELYGPRIVLGDFNDWTRGLASHLLCAHFKSADIRTQLPRFHTYPGLLPFLHLDHMYFDSALQIERLRVYKSRTALIASDHLPLIADFGVRDGSGTTSNVRMAATDVA